jgi:hypothetical protein
MILKVQRQVNGEWMVSTSFDVGSGLSHRRTVRNVSRETFRSTVGEMVGQVESTRQRFKQVLASLDLPQSGGE